MKIRVLIWCPYVNPGGGARLLIRLIGGLSRNPNVELVRIACSVAGFELLASQVTPVLPVEFFRIFPTRPIRTMTDWLKSDSLVYGIRGTGRTKRILSRAIGLKPVSWLDEQLRNASRGVDVVYAFWPHLAEPAILNDVPVVCTFQDTILLQHLELIDMAESEEEWRRSADWISQSAAVVVSSESTKRTLLELFGDRGPEPVVVPHRILPDVPVVSNLSSRPSILPEKYIIYPANISPHKNHHTLLTAWARLDERERIPLVFLGSGTAWAMANPRPPWALPAVGPGGWHGIRLPSLIRRLGLKAGKDFLALNYLPDADVLPAIGHASALVMPSFAEGGGSYPVEEALTLGVPVMCSDIPVMREHLAERSARIAWFDPYSPEAIQRAYRELMADYDGFKVSAVAGMSDPRPTWDDVAAGYVRVFQSVVEGARHA